MDIIRGYGPYTAIRGQRAVCLNVMGEGRQAHMKYEYLKECHNGQFITL
jgi:hypothetical protein